MSIPIPEKRVAEFENFGMGMFVHWGLYSLLGQGEWVGSLLKMPFEAYAKLSDAFTASDFDARQLVQLAKNAGAKYITLTTRHHDGFSLYDTCGLNPFDAPHSVCGRDLVKEFVNACHEADISPFLYHTTLDWYHPDFQNNFPKYLQYLRDSIEILCTNYGKIGGFWFDGNWSKKDEDWEEDALYRIIRRYQPDAMIINNTGLKMRGCFGNSEIDSVEFEQGQPAPMNREGHSKYVAAEMCQTISGHWGYAKNDLNYKSLPDLIETLCACRKVGANYLLNVGLTGAGKVPLIQEAYFDGIGDWIRATGNVIYTAKPCGISEDDKNFALADGKRLFFFVHNLSLIGNENVTVSGGCAFGNRYFHGVKGKIRCVHWTDNGEALSFSQDGETVSIHCTGYPYGRNLVVRVAEAELE